MSDVFELIPTVCAICDKLDNAVELYPANFDRQAFNPATFSARRLPDRLHYRIVCCKVCGLVRSDPIIDSQTLEQLYGESTQTYDQELDNLRVTYVKYLSRAGKWITQKNSLLEIGCGSGFFLTEALNQGFLSVRGVEPSREAVEKAKLGKNAQIICDVMRPNLFDPQSFDIVCMFQVFDHLPNPNELLEECYKLLKPGGVVLILNHDVGSFSAKMLGANSPIIDIEHTYLYSKNTIRKIVSKHGFDVLEVGSVVNTYSFSYLIHLIPLPIQMKKKLLDFFNKSRIGFLKMSIRLGNLYMIARKPESKPSLILEQQR